MDGLVWAAAAAVVLSGFFSLLGHGLRNASRHQLEEALGQRHPARLAALLKHSRQLQMTCSLLRSLSNLVLLAVLLVALWTPGASAWSAVAAVAVAAGLIAVFGVAIPQAWAHHAADTIVARTAVVLLALRKALWPIVAAMAAIDVPVRRLSGVSDEQFEEGAGPNGREDAVKAEILHVASEGQAQGAVDPDEVDMIESVIEFGDSRAGEIMTPRTDIVALPVDATSAELRGAILDAGHTRIPLYDGDIDNIIGILHAKDLLGVESLDQMDLRRLMRKPFFVPETKRLDDLLREFKARKSHMAIVLDEYGGTAGLVTVEDLIEEIVGDIADEYDKAPSSLIKTLDDRSVEVDGRLRIDELNDALGLELPEEEDYDTVAGFVFSELGFIPPVGETLVSHHARFTVLAADARKITRLKVEALDRPAAEP